MQTSLIGMRCRGKADDWSNGTVVDVDGPIVAVSCTLRAIVVFKGRCWEVQLTHRDTKVEP